MPATPRTLHGFSLVTESNIPEIESLAQIWRHDKTGARLLSLISQDENKVFGISFRTPPSDCTGIAHILEHSVLCGSRKYPVKEPFVELLKGSLQTFLNAFTFPDKTCYPVASANLQDFYNLIDVYLDAVFYPRLTPQVLEQEGWHHEVDAEGKLVYKGVVMGEMKGAYSSPDALLGEYSQQAVFPNSTYGLDSGGDPERIPDLTFEAFQDFHQRYYHPSNSYIYFSGNDDPAKRLEILDAYLRDFEARPECAQASAVALQPRLPTPTRVEKFYAAEHCEDDEDGAKAQVSVNWLLTRVDRPGAAMTLAMLDHILVGLPSSPLRKALIDSGLGEDLCGVGLEEDLRQMYFSVGLKGLDPADTGKVRPLILETLESVATAGLPAEVIEAAVNTVEFDLREMNTGRFPRGLSLMLQALTTWLHDADPLMPLAFEAPLAGIKARLAAGEPVFENLIRSMLLDNPHRAEVVLLPDPELAARREAAERQRLAKLEAMLGPDGLAAVAANAQALKEAQERADTPEALASIPRLKVADLPRENQKLPNEVLDLTGAAGTTVLLHDLPTRGICYLDVGLDLTALPQEYLPCVPLFGRALLEMGTEAEDFVSLTRRIARKTGGIDAQPFAGTREADAAPVPWLFLRAKATVENIPHLLAILKDVLLTTRFDDQERFRKMVLEEKARLEERLIPAGHGVVAGRMRAGLSASGAVSELFSGVEQLFFLRRLAEAVDKDWARVLSSLEDMRKLMVRRPGLLCNVTMPAADYHARLRPELLRLAQAVPQGEASPAATLRPKQLPAREGLTIPAQVNYVGKGVNLDAEGYKLRGGDQVVARFMRNTYLWDRVRVQGGAYGAHCVLDRLSGVMLATSYRDPNVTRTLGIYDAMREHLMTLEISPDELASSIVGAIGDMDAYLLPDAKGFTAMARWLQGIGEASLQELREEMLSTTIEDFRRFGRAAGLLADRGRVAILGSREALGAAELDLAITKVL